MILIVHYSISSVEMFLNRFYDNESNYINCNYIVAKYDDNTVPGITIFSVSYMM